MFYFNWSVKSAKKWRNFNENRCWENILKKKLITKVVT